MRSVVPASRLILNAVPVAGVDRQRVAVARRRDGKTAGLLERRLDVLQRGRRRAREALVVLVVDLERARGDRGGRLGVGVLRLGALVEERREGDRAEDHHDRQHHEDFDHGEPALAVPWHELDNG